MSDHAFVDTLADSVITLGDSSFESHTIKGDGAAKSCTSLFFPGCSFVNYAQDLLDPLMGKLQELGIADGVSLVCCGKILNYEQDAATVKPAFQAQLLARLKEKGVRRIVTACPNCMKEFRALFGQAEGGAGIEVEALPKALADAGQRIGEDDVRSVLCCDPAVGLAPGEAVRLAVHDSCPDRARGEFGRSVRSLLPPGMLVEPKHSRSKSQCCGALANAAGDHGKALRQAQRRGEEGLEAQAHSLVTSCMSCVNLLNSWQDAVPVHHYLEFLLGTCIDWKGMPDYLDMRFLFEEMHGTRSFYGASAPAGCCPQPDLVEAEVGAAR